jgi:CO/xanthine dehydrogenase FAD-binding subunit
VVKIPGLLEGKKLTDVLLRAVSQEAVDTAHPAGNLAMDTEYRREMAGELAKRALLRAMALVPR